MMDLCFSCFRLESHVTSVAYEVTETNNFPETKATLIIYS